MSEQAVTQTDLFNLLDLIRPWQMTSDAKIRIGADADGGGAWWRFKALLTEVEKDFTRRGPYVRAFWRDFEEPLLEETVRFVASMPAGADARRGVEGEFVASVWERASTALDKVTAEVAAL